MKYLKAIEIKQGYIDTISFTFSEFVLWKNGSEDLVQIQNIIEEHKCKKIIVNLNDTVYFDTLLLIHFLLYLEKANDLGILIEVELIDRDNLEHIRFLNYLMEAGFINILGKYDSKIVKKTKEVVENFGTASMQYANYSSQDIVYPIKILHEEKEIEKTMEEVCVSLRNLDLNTSNTMLKINTFLQETIENVYEHAYGNSEYKYCALYICRKVKHKEEIRAKRNYLMKDHEIKEMNYKQFNAMVINDSPYRTKTFCDTRADYLEVYVADIGQGILHSIMEPYIATEERSLLNRIFLSGHRINRREKNTQAGGLYMINNIFEKGADALGIRSEYSWFPFECGSDTQFSEIKNGFVLKAGYLTNKVITGFSIVGYINIFGKITKEYSSEFHSASFKNVIEIYKNHNKIDYSFDEVDILDFRFDYLPSRKKDITKKNVLILLDRDVKKNTIVKKLNNITENNSIVYNLFITDFPDYETSKYYLIFCGMYIKVQNLYLISQNYRVAAFCRNQKGFLEYNIKMTQAYLLCDKIGNSIEKNLYGYINCLIKYESKLFWNALGDFQNQSDQKILVNENIVWNFKSKKYMTTYMDFSQSSFIGVCREILLKQLFRLTYILRVKAYFISADRFTKDICDIANAEMGNDFEGIKINIGSAYVTGTSSLKQMIEEHSLDDKWFYFFLHPDCEEPIEVATLLEWKARDRSLVDKKEANYKRIEKTPFIAQEGADFFRKWRYNDKNSVINMQPDRMYRYLQESGSWTDIVFSLGHIDLEGPHDFMIFNVIKMFEKDRLESYTQPKLLDTSYDYLLCKVYSVLGRNSKFTKKSLEEELNCNVPSYYATQEKLLAYDIMKKKIFDEGEGLLLYFTDYATIRIIRYFQRIFNEEINRRIIPLSLINPRKGAASLLLSPLLVEGLIEIISKLKKRKKVMIFTSMIISTKLLDELQHILYCLGADTVEILTVIDRQRLPFGYSKNDYITTFWKMDIPPLGNKHNCILCKGLTEIEKFKENLNINELKQRIDEIEKQWRSQKSYNNNLSVITSRKIDLPKEIQQSIVNYSKKYDTLKNLEITTDLGLVLFSVESMAITQSLDFLDKCLVYIEESIVKIILLCAHLCLFKKEEISERKYFELAITLFDCLAEQEQSSNYSGLAVIVVAAQQKSIICALKEKARQILEKRACRGDALICSLYILYMSDEILNSNINFYFKSNMTILEMVMGIFQYTYRECVNSHSGILIRMYERGITFSKENYVEALQIIYYLEDIYEKIPKNLFSLNWENKNIFNDLKIIIKKQEELLKEYAESAEEKSVELILDQNHKLIDCANVINNYFFRTSLKRDLLQKDINAILNECINIYSEEAVKKTLDNIIIEWPKVDENISYWYCFTKDISDEISYLIQDFCYLKKTMVWSDPDNYEEKCVTGVIFPKFEKESLEIHFYNSVALDFDLEEYIRIKRTKENRPSIIRIKQLFSTNKIQEVFDYHLIYDETNGNILDACLKIPYIYIRNL